MPSSIIDKEFLQKYAQGEISASSLRFYATMEHLIQTSPRVASSIIQELVGQRTNLKLIASENFSSLAVQHAMGNLLTDKYAEGYPGHRFYAGCENVDDIESYGASLARKLFGAEYAYIQPHSGSDANLIAFLAALSAKVQAPLVEEIGITKLNDIPRDDWEKIRAAFLNQKILAMDYYSGGHLTHGYRYNFSGMIFDAHLYTVDPDTFLVDLDAMRKQLHEIKPAILMAGYSAYPRKLNFAKLREMADEVNAILMVDMAHFAGLVAGKVFTGEYDPVPYAHIVTSTTHKTLRGPRGGFILADKEFGPWVDKACPQSMGGPIPNMMAAKAIAFEEALKPEFGEYAAKIVENSNALAETFNKEDVDVVTQGTDNHLLLLDVTKYGLNGRQAEAALRACNITLNRNALPFDRNGPWYTSGLRLGTAAVTTLGMGEHEMTEIAKTIKAILEKTMPGSISSGDRQGQVSKAKYHTDSQMANAAKEVVADLLNQYPLYPEIDHNILESAISTSEVTV